MTDLAGQSIAGLIDDRVPVVADWPQPGVAFRDVNPLLADPAAFGAVVEALADAVGPVDAVLGIEARGFVFGTAVAMRRGVGFVPVRKAGKLPGPTLTQTYDLEYGAATVELRDGALAPGQRVAVIDDVLATGGTLAAALTLVCRAGAEVAHTAVVIEIEALGGRSRVSAPLTALRTY